MESGKCLAALDWVVAVFKNKYLAADAKFDLSFKRWVGVLSGIYYGVNSFNYKPIVKSGTKKLANLFKKVSCFVFYELEKNRSNLNLFKYLQLLAFSFFCFLFSKY